MAKNNNQWKKHNDNFRRWLQVEMSLLNVTPNDLSRLVGCCNQQIYKIFSEKEKITKEFRYEIIQALAVVIEGRDKVKFYVPKVGMSESDEESAMYEKFDYMGADYYFDENKRNEVK